MRDQSTVFLMGLVAGTFVGAGLADIVRGALKVEHIAKAAKS